MKILFVSLMSSCNQNPLCDYCPVKKWLVPINSQRNDINLITNKDLLKWIDEFLPSGVPIEFTGGEPALYEIDELLDELQARNRHGIVKTNGIKQIKKVPNFQIVTAWHKNCEFPKTSYDWILIIRNPDDNWQDKVNYCESNNIPYKTVAFNGEISEVNHTIKGIMHINSSGQITPCPKCNVRKDLTIFNMSSCDFRPVGKNFSCKACKNIHDAEIFMPDEIKKAMNNYEE